MGRLSLAVRRSVPLCLVIGGVAIADPPQIPRDFDLPLPLFNGAWLEDATSAPVLPGSASQMTRMYKVLCGDPTGLVGTGAVVFPYPDVTFDEYTIPIFGTGVGPQSVDICDYEGTMWFPGSRWGVDTLGGPITVPSCVGSVRPSDPVGMDSDGHLVLYDPATSTEYDFWQASTARTGLCQSQGAGLTGTNILEAGAADFFDVHSTGTNPFNESSARAMGTALLAGLLLPEDVESGTISHALALAILGPRNTSPDPSNPMPGDVFYPAATTETDQYSTDPFALAAGQRLRARPTLVDDTGAVINENDLAPITRMFLAALRTYGAYVVDNAGGFTFYAEDIHTADPNLGVAEVNTLIGQPQGTPIPPGVTKWQLVIEALNADFWDTPIPIAWGTCSGTTSVVNTANFEVVTNAIDPADPLFADGFESGDLSTWSSTVP